MADPHTGAPESPRVVNASENLDSTAARTKRQARLSDSYSDTVRSITESTSSVDSSRRVLTRDIQRMIDSLIEFAASHTPLME
jgi:hypothetical protein